MRLDKLWRRLRWAWKDGKRFGSDHKQAEKETDYRRRLHPCVAHRGWSGAAPENTLAAFRLALQEPTVAWMELDVHLSSDEVPVVIHDGALKRTTNGRGYVREWTAEQLGSLDAGSWFHRSFSGEGVPTLDQVLELVAGRCKLNVELKGDTVNRKQLAFRAIDVIAARNLISEVVITSFEPELLREAKRKNSAARTGLIIDGNPPGLLSGLEEIGADYLSIGFRNLTGTLLAEAQMRNIEVMAWTVNTPLDLQRLADRPEPFQICTNYPDRWLAATSAREESRR